MKPFTFQCQKCGRCCHDLILRDENIVRGLTLIPGEEHHFPCELIKPAVGIGKRPYDKNFKVIAYQLISDSCPNLVNKLCKIYNKRPSSCRQYPFSLDLGKDGQTLIGFDMNCPALQEMVNMNSNMQLDFEEQESAGKLLQLKQTVNNNPNKAWLYDLETNKWVKHKE